MTLSQEGEKICFFSIFAVEAKVCDKNTHQHQVIVTLWYRKDSGPCSGTISLSAAHRLCSALLTIQVIYDKIAQQIQFHEGCLEIAVCV